MKKHRIAVGVVLTRGSPPEVAGAADSTYPVNQIRSARLLGTTRTTVNDAIFFQAADLSKTLGICTSGNYDGAWINTQQRQNGPFHTGTDMTHLITCGGDSYANTNSQQQNTDDLWQQFAPAGSGTTVTNADDCNRLCAWLARYWRDLPDGTQSDGTLKDSKPYCEAWEWGTDTGNTANNKCYLWRQRLESSDLLSKNTSPRAGILSSGGNARGLKQVQYLTSWKRSLSVGESGRYKRDVLVKERSEDAMKVDLTLRATL